MLVVMILADGFEEVEAVATADVLNRVGFPVVKAGLETKNVRGAHNITVVADCLLEAIDAGNVSMLILPGGMPGSTNLKNSRKVVKMIGEVCDAGRGVAAICAAPIALAEAGVLHGRRITCYPGFELELPGANYSGAEVETDGNVITARGPGAAFAFAKAIATFLGRGGEAEKVLGQMLVE